jgi:hypothetical protein
MEDKTWELSIRVRVTTLCGWQPDRDDIEGWLENGGVLELVAVDSAKEIA